MQRQPTAPFRLPAQWPPPADAEAAQRLVERFAELGRAEAALARRAPVASLLRALGGNAPYLADLALRESAALRRLVRDGPDAVVAEALAELAAAAPTLPRARIAALLRRAKRVAALAVAIADIGGVWTLEQVTGALSTLAEATLGLAVQHLLRAAHDAGELRLPHPDRPGLAAGFTVLGMGKLGAGELNYSSDIDLILLYDPDCGVYPGDEPRAFYTRMARHLVTLMEARDADGYVFRTDLRLRPDPAATAPAISLPAAIAYYESMGQNWERAAMLKARPVAGDLALGHEFLDAIRPFVWRRHLDFVALSDMQAMKQRIDEHKGTGPRRLGPRADPLAGLLGLDIKLGEGGIREVEFLAQSLQLAWGGRDPGLRSPRTLEALRALARGHHLPARLVPGLAATYRFLRAIEHRLQMIADRQTHSLPDSAAALDAFARFMGFAGAGAFARALRVHQRRVVAAYAAVFASLPVGDAPWLDFSGSDEAPPRTRERLAAMGFANPEAIVAAARGWQAGRVRALRSERSQALMNQVLPPLLEALAGQPQPDAAFARFDALLARLPAGVQLLSLFQRNPPLVGRIAAVLGASPSLADHLARSPSALEGLLAPEDAPDPARLLRGQLRDARTLEDSIAIIRAAVREEEFALSVATMEGRLDADAAGAARADLADAALAALLPPVLDDFASRFGRVRGGGLALVALGKAGGREMMAGSDLDLMLIYDHAAGASESAGRERRLPASQWFIRAVHGFVAAITAPDAEGPMFAVDMRLRPSGNKGPVAVSLASFEHYHRPPDDHPQGAWTWERMALTRARVIAGPPALRRRVEAAIRSAIANAGAPARLRADAAAMRARLLRDLPPKGPWDVKARPGGQIEVEFIAQTLQLAHAARHPELCHPTTREALARLAAAGLLPAADAALLIRADHAWRTVQGMLRITYGRGRMDRLAQSTATALLRATAAAGLPGGDIETLRASLEAMAGEVRACFIRHVGDIVS